MPQVKAEPADTWAFDADKEESEDAESVMSDVKARLWSGKIPAKFGMQCLTLVYFTSHSHGQQPGGMDGSSLSLLQRQEG